MPPLGQSLTLSGKSGRGWPEKYAATLFFAVKYYFSYQQATHPLFLNTPAMPVAVGGVSGFTVGLFCGRALRLQRALTVLRRDKGIVLP